MATIEERAKEYATDLRGAYREEFFNESTYYGYVKGATDQRKIDTENACKNLELLLKAIETYDNKEALISEFRKSLEE